MIFTIELLPARHGDALWTEYGQPDRPHRILIDGGPSSSITRKAIEGLISDRIGTVADGQTDFELMVVTHIDADHITGMLSLLEKRSIALRPRDVWFNGWEHLPDDVLGAKQGERLSAAVVRRRIPWNEDFDGRAVVVSQDDPLPVVELPGGLTLTLLSPTRQALAELRPVWKAEVEKAGLVPGQAAEDERAAQPDVLGDDEVDPEALAEEAFVEDGSEANGSSIAFLAEFEGKSVLLTGDAHAGILADGLRRLARQRGTDTVEVDAFKLPHHGSKFNLSPAVLDLV
ncbi:MAG: MBL fold metallo-hydrolase, partial [Pseudonocardiaceae bacterium]